MAGLKQGGVYRCDFGPSVGRELSRRRNALVLSSADLHNEGRVAIVVPTSGREPHRTQLAWHRRVGDTGSWASIRQVKAIPLRFMEAASPLGFADGEELKDIRQRMVWYSLAAARMTRLTFAGGMVALRPGSLLTIDLGPGSGNDGLAVVLGSCRRDGMANVFVVSDRRRPGSTLAVDLESSVGPLTVLPHQVRTVDLSCRLLSVDGILDIWSVIAIKCRFFDLIAIENN